MAVKPLCQEEKPPTTFYVRATRVPGLGRQVDRVNVAYTSNFGDECHSFTVAERFIRETTALIAADAAGLPGKNVSSQTIGDLEILGIGVRVGPRVALVDRVEIAHLETPA